MWFWVVYTQFGIPRYLWYFCTYISLTTYTILCNFHLLAIQVCVHLHCAAITSCAWERTMYKFGVIFVCLIRLTQEEHTVVDNAISLLKCYICSKPYKRKAYLTWHIANHAAAAAAVAVTEPPGTNSFWRYLWLHCAKPRQPATFALPR